jgi:hypothetical protein
MSAGPLADPARTQRSGEWGMDEGGLTEPECWELLAHADIGRLGVVPG